MKKLIFFLCCILTFEANAQVKDTTKKNVADTIKKDILTAPDTVKHLHSKGWTFIPPAVFVTYGALSFWVNPIRNVDYYINDEIKKHYGSSSTKLENYFQFAPVVMVYGLNLVGITGKNRFIDRSALLGLSAVIMSSTTFTLKHLTHRLRPNGADYYSFPSGHTGNAFMGAEFLAQEYSGKAAYYGIVGYGFAVTTGVLRMYNHDHWFSDVVAGAGFGILSTKAAYLIYPYIRNALTHSDKKGNKNTMIMPMYQDGAVGLSLTSEF